MLRVRSVLGVLEPKMRRVLTVLSISAPLASLTPFAPAPLAPNAPLAPSARQFDDDYSRLQRGREYSARVSTGAMKRRHGQFEYWLVVPKSYDPANRYQVLFYLHGGVMRPESSLRGDGSVRLDSGEQIYIMPAGWSEAPWWSDAQAGSLRAILEDVKRDYNVDENRVFVSGVSDGGTGVFYVAMRDTTPYAGFLPLNGWVLVLRNPALSIGSGLFLNNLRNKPFFIVNGGRDPLYPANLVEPSVDYMNAAGVPITYRPQPQAGHDTSWWPNLRAEVEAFTKAHPRVPLPDRVTWEVSGTRAWNRAHWLVIDSMGETPNDSRDMVDVNQSAQGPVFKNGKSGRVDLARSGNIVTAVTRGVKEFTLLISPDQFDFTKPLKVIINGRVAYDAPIEKSVATLLKWAARDNDRTMLFGTEIRLRP